MNRTLSAMFCLALVITLANILGQQPIVSPLLLLTVVTLLAAHLLPAPAWRYVISGLLVLSGIVLCFALLQVGHLARPKGPFGSPNLLAGYAVLHLFLALFMRAQAKHPRLCDALAAVNLLSLALSQSLGGVLALVAGLGVIAACRFRRWLPEVLTLSVLTFCIIASANPRPFLLDNPRIGLWLQGWRIAHWRLLTGYGQRDFLVPPNFVHFYSSAITLLVTAGIVGLGVGIWLLATALRRAWAWPQTQESLALRGFLVAWIVYGVFMYDTPATTLPLYVVLAMLGSKDRNVAHAAVLIDDGQPLARLRQGAGRAA